MGVLIEPLASPSRADFRTDNEGRRVGCSKAPAICFVLLGASFCCCGRGRTGSSGGISSNLGAGALEAPSKGDDS